MISHDMAELLMMGLAKHGPISWPTSMNCHCSGMRAHDHTPSGRASTNIWGPRRMASSPRHAYVSCLGMRRDKKQSTRMYASRSIGSSSTYTVYALIRHSTGILPNLHGILLASTRSAIERAVRCDGDARDSQWRRTLRTPNAIALA